jgi:hypothetical protein
MATTILKDLTSSLIFFYPILLLTSLLDAVGFQESTLGLGPASRQSAYSGVFGIGYFPHRMILT